MLDRRSWFRALTSGAAALAVLVLPVLAEELFGTIKSVDSEAKKIVVTEKGTLGDVEVKVTDDTVIETAKGEKLALGKLKKGLRVQVTHEDEVASKIVVKGAGKKKESPPK